MKLYSPPVAPEAPGVPGHCLFKAPGEARRDVEEGRVLRPLAVSVIAGASGRVTLGQCRTPRHRSVKAGTETTGER